MSNYPFRISDIDGVIDRADNVDTVESILYGDLANRPDGPCTVNVPPGADHDDDAKHIELVIAMNVDCWGLPWADTVTRHPDPIGG